MGRVRKKREGEKGGFEFSSFIFFKLLFEIFKSLNSFKTFQLLNSVPKKFSNQIKNF
jgi:hypothetical protein